MTEDETIIPCKDQLDISWVAAPGFQHLAPMAVPPPTTVTFSIDNSVLPQPPPEAQKEPQLGKTPPVKSEEMAARLTEAADLVTQDITVNDEMPVLSITEADFNAPQPSTSGEAQQVAAPNFLPTGCEAKVVNFYDSLQNNDDDDEDEPQVIEQPRPSKRLRIDSLRNEISVMAARLYQMVDELDDLKKELKD